MGLLENLKRLARLGNQDAKKELDDLGVNQTTVSSFATGSLRTDLERCLKLTFEEHNTYQGEILAKKLINKGVRDVIPYLCLSAIYGTLEDWRNCELYSEKGLEFDENNLMLLNHMGVAMCQQGKVLGLEYFRRGILLGDKNCNDNMDYWANRL